MPEMGDFLPELICLGVDAVVCAALYHAYSSVSMAIQDLKDAPVIAINEHMKEQIASSTVSEVMPDGLGLSLPYAAVRGEVSPLGKTVSSAYAPEAVSGVIQRVVFTEHKRNLSRAGFWFDSERVLHQYTNDAPFCLTKLQDSSWSLSRPHVEVVDWQDASRIDLDTVYDKFEQGAVGLSSHLWGWVTGDLHKGTQVTEMMLTKGCNLTAVGQLVSTPAGVRIQPPADGRPFYLVRITLSSLIKEFEAGRSGLKLFLGVFSGVGLVISCLAAYKYIKKRKEELAARSNQDTLETIRTNRPVRPARGDESHGDGVPESLQCVVCLGAEREVILLNCGHVCVCADCGGELIRLGQTCPVCRARIASVLPAYVS